MKRLTLVAAVTLLLLAGYGQYVPGGKKVRAEMIPGLLDQLYANPSASQRAAILLDLGFAYLNKKGEEKEDLDKGLSYARQLTELARQTGSSRYHQEALLLTAMLNMERGDFAGSEKLFPSMDDTTRLKTLLVLVGFCNAAAAIAPKELEMLDMSARYVESALVLAIKTKMYHDWMLDALESTAGGYRIRHMVASAEKYYLLALRCTDSRGSSRTARVYSNVSVLYTTEGNFYKAMDYGIRAEKALDSQSGDEDYAYVYNCLGGLNAVQERPEKVLFYYGKLLNEPRRYREHLQFYGAVATYCANLQKLRRLKEVLPFMDKMQQACPPETHMDYYYAHLALGRCYRELRQFDSAEYHFREGIKSAEAGRISTGAINYHLGVLYFQFDQFEKAVATLRLAEQKMSVENTALIAQNTSFLAKAEAALGNYRDGYKYLTDSKSISDSIFSVAKVRLTDELEAQYEAQKKEADIRLKEKNIEALNQDAADMRRDALLKDAALNEAELVRQRNVAELQRNEIALQLNSKEVEGLKRDKELQQHIIRQAEVRKNVTLLVILLMAVIVVLLCWLFWSKMKSNRMINHKNEQLQHLVNDKSWLLKEMHHRVKNNLQTIVSLLESQSAYLQDDALEAIQHSQDRIFAMSLIHQKLYQTDDTKTIDMATYIPELVKHLRESYSMPAAVVVCMDIATTAFNVEEAVALGLIINEAVTNSMKYAFSGKHAGTISIGLQATSDDEYELILADDGVGLSNDFDPGQSTTLGFQLIRGLAEQLRATCSIVNENGLRITIANISVYNTQKVKAMEDQLLS